MSEGHTPGIKVEIVSSRAGPCLCINDHRVAGAKPWGGGHVEYRFVVPESEMQTALADVLSKASGKEPVKT